MLIGLNPLLTPDLLFVLAAMGHGDEIAIVDANFPATRMGKRVLRLDGVDAPNVVEAVLSVMPLDDSTDEPVHVVSVPESAGPQPMIGLFKETIEACAGRPISLSSLERFLFYERAKGAFAIVQTGERRRFGNVTLTKGVVRLPNG